MTTASPTSSSGYLHSLCRQGNVTAIRPLLQEIVDNSQLEERVGFLGYTPLHEATNRGQTSVVRLLLFYGADANAKANGFYTPLHIAASMDHVRCVEELLRHDADITCKDEFGKTPYETAMIHRCKRSARILKSEEVKKAARENNPNLREMLKSIKTQDVVPSCFREALLEASCVGSMNAVCAIIVTGARHSLRLRDCFSEAVRFNFTNSAAVLLICYAAKHDKLQLLRYLLSMEMSEEDRKQALLELPADVLGHPPLDEMRAFIRDRENFNIAVPIGLALQQKKKKSVETLLVSTDCNQQHKRVDWQKLALGEIDPSWLECIPWVEKLSLSSNLLTSIPSNVAKLNRLCRLDLRKNQLKAVPVELLQMSTLRDLNLSENRIYNLPRKCKWTYSLKTLYLTENLLETLPKCVGRAKLVNLYIARNNLYEVPLCICELVTLQTLDLSGNPRLTQLPLQMGRLTEITTLKLDNLDQVTDPPEEIKRNGVKTVMYLRDKLRSSQGYYTIKLMLVGRAEQGKTTLMHRLMRDFTYNTNSPTNGIAMDEFRFRKDVFHRDYIFKIWDFGGQEDFYTTHRCFLSTLALYLLVWNLEEGESGIEMLRGWLDTVSASAPNTNLIIVGTHLDKVRKEKDVGYQLRMRELVKKLVMLPKYNRINVRGIKEVSCAPDNKEGIDDLRVTIYDVATALQKGGIGQVSVMGEMIPHSFLMVADVIQAKRDELRNAGRMPIMHKSEYEALVLDTIKNDAYDIEDSSDLRVVTEFMHERGIIMHYNDPNQDLQDLYFIDPKWLCELMARIVTLPEVNPFIRDGILALDSTSLPFIFKGERFPQENYSQFIRLLHRFQIACSLDDERVLLPSKLPTQRPEEATSSDLHYITLKRIHSLPSIPHGFWSRLISRVLFYTKDMLSGGANYVRETHSSPFQLDPFCCRCPLTVEESASADLGVSSDGQSRLPRCETGETSIVGSVENLHHTPDDLTGVARFFNDDNPPRHRGLFINGLFFGSSKFGSGSVYSDSGFEYSSSDDDEERGATPSSAWESPNVHSNAGKRYFRRDQGRPKYGTDPRVRRDEKVVAIDFGTPKSDSVVPVLKNAYSHISSEDGDAIHQCSEGFEDVNVLRRCLFPEEDADLPKVRLGGPGSTGTPNVVDSEHLRAPEESSGDEMNSDVPDATMNVLRSLDVSRVSARPKDSNEDHGNTQAKQVFDAPQVTPNRTQDTRGLETCSLDRQVADVPLDSSCDAVDEHVSTTNYVGLDIDKLNDPRTSPVFEDSLPFSSENHGEPRDSLHSYHCEIGEHLHGENSISAQGSCQAEGKKFFVSGKDVSESRQCNGELEKALSEGSDYIPTHLKQHSTQSSVKTWLEATNTHDGSCGLSHNGIADSWDLQSGHTNSSSASSSISTEQDFNTEEVQLYSEPSSSVAELENQNIVSEAKASFVLETTRQQEKDDGLIVQEIGCWASENGLTTNTDNEINSAAWAFPGKDSQVPPGSISISNETVTESPSRSETPHLSHCAFRDEFPVESLPQLPADLPTLMDNLFLRCWKSGVCLRHPRLFFLLYCIPDPNSDRQLIVTEVSPCPQGRRVLSYMVDHIDTLIREWYPEFTATDGSRPRTRQLIPCVVCERLGLEPNQFTFGECQLQSSVSDTIRCPNHGDREVNLHLVAPDIMLHDVDEDLLLHHREIKYENSDASILGSGGFGKVVRGECRGQAVAIKFYNQSDESDPLRHYREVRKELNVLRRVRQHPFLINIIGVSLRPLCLVLELAERGALTEILITPMAIHRVVLFRIAYQVADALRFLHDLGVIYRDLKPENVLVWSLDEWDDLHVKIIDFGTANFATSVGLISCKGSRGNHAPEMLQCANKEEYTALVDVYAFGILLYQLITRLPPFDEIESEPKVNAAVIAGDRPKWRHVPRTMFGLPTLTELMLHCWAAKPTMRPTSTQVAEQIRQPAFQCLIGKQPIPSQQSVRHACLVPDLRELWLTCDDHTGNRILVYEGRTLDMKFSFSIDADQEQRGSCQIQCIHFTAPHVLVGVRGGVDAIKAFSISSGAKDKCVATVCFNEQISCIASNEEYIFVGLNEGRVQCILKSEMKKSDKKRRCRVVTAGRHRILSLVVVKDRLWVSSSKYIFRFFTKEVDLDAFELESMWYGGPAGMESNPATKISQLKVSFDKKSVISVCRSVLCKWNAESRQKHFDVDCAPLIRSLTGKSGRHPLDLKSDFEMCITTVEPTSDSIWAGTASGFILIFDSEQPILLTWFHCFEDLRTMTMMIGPGPCGTEQCYVVSTGKGLRREGLGAVCVLSDERVHEPTEESSDRNVSDGGRKRTLKRTLSGRKLKAPSFEDQEKPGVQVESPPRAKCAMIVWEVVSKNSFARVEAKSGRQSLKFSSEIQTAAEGPSLESEVEEKS